MTHQSVEGWEKKFKKMFRELENNGLLQAEWVGDGQYCLHHPDDPAHGASCYDHPILEKLLPFIESLLSTQQARLKEAVEGKKYTFKEVFWDNGITSWEPVEDETKSLAYAQGYNKALDDILVLSL